MSIRKSIGAMLFNGLQLCRADRIVGMRYAGMGTIFMFHRVAPPPAPYFPNSQDMTITPVFLDRLIRHLQQRGIDIIDLDEAAGRVQDNRPGHFACLTFDDGYKDNLEHGLPVCEALGVPMTVYVTTGFTDQSHAAWWLGVEAVLRARDAMAFSFQGRDYDFALQTYPQKLAAQATLRALFMNGDIESKSQLCRVLGECTGVDFYELTSRGVMNPDEIRKFNRSASGRIGAHTISHPVLAKLSDEQAALEIQGSKAALEDMIQDSVRHFAYPFGSDEAAGQRDADICRDAGFKTAVTVRPGNIVPGASGALMQLPRYGVSGRKMSLAAVDLQYSGLYGKIRARLSKGAA